jgi:hypothetical protein
MLNLHGDHQSKLFKREELKGVKNDVMPHEKKLSFGNLFERLDDEENYIGKILRNGYIINKRTFLPTWISSIFILKLLKAAKSISGVLRRYPYAPSYMIGTC